MREIAKRRRRKKARGDVPEAASPVRSSRGGTLPDTDRRAAASSSRKPQARGNHHNWDAWAQKTIPVPLVTGHEFVGRVEKVGSNVTGFAPGDLVSGEGHFVCGRCRNCLAGRRHLCPHTQGVSVNRSGAFAEFLCIPMTNAWGADPHIPLDVLGEDALIAGSI